MVGAELSWLRIVGDLVHFLCLGLRSRTSLAAENLFLRKQLAFYEERKVKSRRADNPTRLSLVLVSRWFNWRDALIVVKPRTFITWHRKGFRLRWATFLKNHARGIIACDLCVAVTATSTRRPIPPPPGLCNSYDRPFLPTTSIALSSTTTTRSFPPS
jgi:putative transposase